MNAPEWLIPGIVGMALGGAIIAVVGFTSAGWMTGSHADTMAKRMGRDQVMAAMVPVRVERSRADPERMGHLESIRQASGTGRRDALMITG